MKSIYKKKSLLYLNLLVYSIVYIVTYVLSMHKLYILSSALFILTSFLIYFITSKVYANFIEPISLFSLFWNSSLGLAMMKLSNLQVEWEKMTWLLFYMIFISFYLAYIIFNNKSIGIKQSEYNIGKEKEKRIRNIIIILTFIFSASIIIEACVLGFVPILSSKPHAYSYFHISGLHYFSTLYVLVPMLCILRSYKKNQGYLKSLLSDYVNIVCVILSFIAPLIIVSRFGLIFMLLLSVMSYFIISKKIDFKIILFAFFLIAVYWVIITFFRNHSKEYLFDIFEIKNRKLPIFFVQPYIYITNNFDNLNMLVLKLKEFTHGKRMLYPALALSGLKFKIPSFYPATIYTTKEELTTLTMFYDSYYDFGIIGTVFFSFVLGIIYRAISIFTCIKRSPSLVLVLSQLNIYLVLSFFTTWFSNPATWFYFIVTIPIYLYVEKNKKISTHS